MNFTSCWYIKQANYFLSDRRKAVPIAKILADPATPIETINFLNQVEAIRIFSTNNLGLNATKNYTTYIHTDKNYVADVVSACAEDSFTRYYWNYLFFGKMPYRGFYEKADAEKEAKKLREESYDVIVRQVDAFSSLGYFTDPIYSFMSDYSEYEMADLIIHESAHATVFVKGQDQFNEELATFIGRKGAELYIKTKYGDEAELFKSHTDNKKDRDTFVAFLKETARLLDVVYNNKAYTKEQKLSLKASILSDRAIIYKDTASKMFISGSWQNFDMSKINNAYIDLYRLYEEDLSLYELWYTKISHSDLQQFVSSILELSKKETKNIKAAMVNKLELQ